MPTVLRQIAERVQSLVLSKWHWNIHHFAKSIGLSLGEANGFIRCIENEGTGSKPDNTWRPNPAPFITKHDLNNHNCDNPLNLYYTDMGDKNTSLNHLSEPSVVVLEQGSRYIRLGRVSGRNKEVTVKVQKEIVKFVIGTHKTLTQHYPEVAKFRKESWRSWVDGGENHDMFQ